MVKAVILGIAPEAKIVDLNHGIGGGQNARESALVPAWQVFSFQEGSIHIVAVDPGLGKQHCPIVAQNGCVRLAVISAVGTREYYAGRGFERGELYMIKNISPK